jgi:trans-aconitate 2-methyltransferase
MTASTPPRVEWDGAAYHQVSDPQLAWGRRVLARLAPTLRGDEVTLDAGCGTGRLTAELATHLPEGRLLGLDRDPSMLSVARRELPASIPIVRADLLAIPFRETFDLVFSTATFHWVLDHAALFREIRATLRPAGGRLVAQCGGFGNLAATRARAAPILAAPPFAEHMVGFKPPWNFADPDTTATRLRAAGFSEIATSLEPAPSAFATAEAYAAFAAAVVFRGPLARFPTDELRREFITRITEAAARADPPLSMDYVRLNLEATTSP